MSAVMNSSLNASARLGLRWIEPKDADIAFDPWNLVMTRNPRKPSSEEEVCTLWSGYNYRVHPRTR